MIDTATRITLVNGSPFQPSRRWASASPQARVISIADFNHFSEALLTGFELGRNIERLIIDKTIEAAEFLAFLSKLPAEFAGDVLYLSKEGRVFLSATGERRALHTLTSEDLDFYVATLLLEEAGIETTAAGADDRESDTSAVPGVRLRPVIAPTHGLNTVLIADDDRRVRQELAERVTELGFEAMLATTGTEALRIASEVRPAFIFLDGLLPLLHGFEVARLVRNLDPGYVPRIVMITGVYKRLRYQNDARLKYGIDCYLIKPASPDALRRVLQTTGLPQPYDHPMYAAAVPQPVRVSA